jgi:hypothetical protein
MTSKPDLAAAGVGVLGAAWLGMGDLNSVLAIAVAGLTVLLLLIRIGLAVRQWRRGD